MRHRAFPALWWFVLVAFLVWFGSAQATNRYWITLGITAMWTATAAVGINVLLGSTGLISLGHYAFVVIGGFAGAIWAVEDLGLSPWLGFPFAFVVGAALGAALAFTCCHLHGFYLTVVTLAFGLVASAFALLLDNMFNGFSGRPVARPLDTNFSFIDASNPNRPFVGLYWIGVVLLLFSLYLTQNLVRSRWGRAYRAIRESELAARACGVSAYWYKVSAFALSAGIVALAGVLAAQTSLQVTMLEGTVTVGESFRLVVYALVGGITTIGGPVVGTFIFTLAFGLEIGGKSISDWLVWNNTNWEPAFLAALVIAVRIAAPAGVAGALTRAGRRLLTHFNSARDVERSAPAVVVTDHALLAPARAATSDDATPLLEVRNLGIKFGGLAAIREVDLTVTRGTVHALIGPNGSGKSTLINLITGVYRPDDGTVRFRGRVISKLPTHRRARLGITRTFQNLQLWRNMTALENVMVGAHPSTRVDLVRSVLLPRWMRREEQRVREAAVALLGLVGLLDRASKPAGTLTSSEQHRLEIARALASRPELLVLDEPAAGMTAVEARDLVALIERIRAAGITVLLIEHRMEIVMGLADRMTVLNFGETIADGSPDEVRNDPLVVAAYLGKRRAPERTAAAAGASRVSSSTSGAAREPTAAPRGEPMLTVRDLEVHYGGIRALRGIDFEVYQGEVVALIGANGAGKSTSLKTVSGMPELFKSVRGQVTYLGERIERRPAHRIARMGIAHVPEGRRVFAESTVEENLLLGGYGRRESSVRREFDAIYDRFPSLGRRRDRLAGLLSGGEQQMLAVARALASRPRFLLLDEPSLGLAPIIAHQVFEIVRGLADEGVTVLVVEQATSNALVIADRAYVLEIGAIVAHGPAASFIDDPEVEAAYLGE